MVDEMTHIPVMLKETLQYLNLSEGKTIVDATVGMGGHSEAILERLGAGGRLIGIDRDRESLELAAKRLLRFGNAFSPVYGNFTEVNTILQELRISRIDGILFDLGVSSFQLEEPQRGFSFMSEGPLDMRLDRNSYISAYDLVNNLNEDEISAILWNFGQERWHNRIAHYLVTERQKHPIATTTDLSEAVKAAIPGRYKFQRIHPATRTFQALRLAVNRELEALESAIHKSVNFLDKGGRICIISFHSLEDRIVKLSFKNLASKGLASIITEKPLVPKEEEVTGNPSSRSAKLRVAERSAAL
jgi:16S rRNA (cytosine1402-N4)-methyltransferase